MKEVMLAQFARGDSIQTLVNSEFFAFSLSFLFAFAVIYGLLTQAEIPNDKHARVVIALASGFLVLPAAPTIATVLTGVSSGLVVAIGAVLIVIVLIELLGISGGTTDIIHPEEEAKIGEKKKPIYETHNKLFIFAIVVIFLLVLANAGWFGAVGLPTPRFLFNSPLVFFLIFIIAIVTWTATRG